MTASPEGERQAQYFFIRRPVLAGVLSLIITMMGLLAIRLLPISRYPQITPPAIQVIALNLAYLAGGIVVVEFVFGYPGIGGGFVGAVQNRDFPVVQALAIIIAGVYVLLNVIADVATILVSPRLRTSIK